MRVTCGVATKNRYEQLALALQSVAMQTHKEVDVIIVDDSEPNIDIRTLPAIQSVLTLFNQYGINWRVIYGAKMGQHISHQLIQEQSENELIWRIDDDEIAEPDVLAKLINAIGSNHAGAVGGLVIVPPGGYVVPKGAEQKIENANENVQWFLHPGEADLIPVDHLHSTFLYRKGIAEYERGLSPVAHREETLFTHEIKRAGYGLYVVPWVVTWHLRSETGGIRSRPDPKFWDDDEKLFQDRLSEWGVNSVATKYIVLDAGKGDHVIVKNLLPELKKKYGKLVIAACYNDVFEDDDVELISIAEAKVRLGNIDRYNIYKAMIDWNWKDSLELAFRKLYGI